ncbi:MAG: lysoplasmalogenase family protein [Anaerolineae bacterium]|nr:lysoplasmalogenase family protein [Anaerolineae bacterium]
MIWLLPALAFTGIDLYAAKMKLDRLQQVTRLLPGLGLFVWYFQVVMPASPADASGRLEDMFIFWGLLFLLVAELLRQLPSPREPNAWAAHFLAILSFALAFGGPVFPDRYLIPGLILAAALLGLGFWVFSMLAPSLDWILKAAAALYTVLVSALLLSAASTLVTGWGMLPSYTVIAGAALWYLAAFSDGWRRYIEPRPGSDFDLRLLFLAGQFCLAAGAGVQAMGLFDFTI